MDIINHSRLNYSKNNVTCPFHPLKCAWFVPRYVSSICLMDGMCTWFVVKIRVYNLEGKVMLVQRVYFQNIKHFNSHRKLHFIPFWSISCPQEENVVLTFITWIRLADSKISHAWNHIVHSATSFYLAPFIQYIFLRLIPVF